jgi:NAD(P) transhydrogenase subunit beta
MSANLQGLLYLVAGVLFILALRGLSSPESSRRGNTFGIAGMVIAVLTTLAAHPPAGIGAWILVILGMGLGGVRPQRGGTPAVRPGGAGGGGELRAG